MKFDISKMPVAEAVIGSLVVAIAITFFLAFDNTGGDDTGQDSAAVSPTEPADGDGGSPTPGDGGDGGATEVALSMTDNAFDPNEVTVSAGATVSFNVTNDGAAIHNIRVAGADNEYDNDDDAVSDPDLVSGGSTATLEWTAPDSAATIDFRCDFHPTDMTGTITVE
jgi:plastocyanin